MGRTPKVCEACLGNAESTQHKCSGIFGSKGCNDWLWGWFLVDDTVHRAAKSYKEAEKSTSNQQTQPAICNWKYGYCGNTDDGRSCHYNGDCDHKHQAGA